VKWSDYNQSIVRRGEILIGFDVVDNWDMDLKEIYKDKVGEPFHYPNTFLLLLGHAKVYFRLPCIQTEGIAQGQAKGKLPSIPDYSTINRRTNRLSVKAIDDGGKELKDEYIIIAIDSTGIKITNRGQWMNEKWKVRRKGYLKIHVAIYAKSRKILSMRVTDEHLHDGKALPELVENVIKPNSMTAAVGKLFAGGACDGHDIFRYLADNGILPCIKLRKNVRVRLKTGHILRNLSF
jgi:hypothetical protein